jgi:hypothetical protein
MAVASMMFMVALIPGAFLAPFLFQYAAKTFFGWDAPMVMVVLMPLPVLAVAIAVGHLGQRRMNALRCYAKSRSWQVCPRCHYDMASREYPYRCPECGEDWTEAELRAAWRAGRQ